MFYPKIKKKKRKFKMNNITDSIKNLIYTGVKIFQSKEYFILFMKKSFHF